ncbi:MAG: hypothetical protein KJO18_05470 [Acidimicrobiia bacterium]|nr:hypothetical protein [Acidimicrobiia bacterium]
MTNVLSALAAEGAELMRPDVGWQATLGQVAITVAGPLRRYASDNDGSIVLRAGTPLDPDVVLLTADIEDVAQRELGPPDAEILKVPHHGSATSDLAWLASADSSVAVVSVGANNFGHPSESVIETLEDAGMTVLRTDDSGDVAFPISRR